MAVSLAFRNASQHSVHLTGGILRHFRALSTPKQNPAFGVLSHPAPAPVTQTVRSANKRSTNRKENLRTDASGK